MSSFKKPSRDENDKYYYSHPPRFQLQRPTATPSSSASIHTSITPPAQESSRKLFGPTTHYQKPHPTQSSSVPTSSSTSTGPSSTPSAHLCEPSTSTSTKSAANAEMETLKALEEKVNNLIMEKIEVFQVKIESDMEKLEQNLESIRKDEKETAEASSLRLKNLPTDTEASGSGGEGAAGGSSDSNRFRQILQPLEEAVQDLLKCQKEFIEENREARVSAVVNQKKVEYLETDVTSRLRKLERTVDKLKSSSPSD